MNFYVKMHQHLLNSCTELLFFEYFANLSIVISILRVRVTKLMWGLRNMVIDSLECSEDIYFRFEIFSRENIWLLHYKASCERNKVSSNLVHYFIPSSVKVLKKLLVIMLKFVFIDKINFTSLFFSLMSVSESMEHLDILICLKEHHDHKKITACNTYNISLFFKCIFLNRTRLKWYKLHHDSN